jgi:hypothetical protein
MTAAGAIWREGRKGLLGRIAWEARAFLEAAGDDVLAGEVDGARLAGLLAFAWHGAGEPVVLAGH